jgi:hypothetical protein
MADQDIPAIVNVINLYGLAMDTQRWDLFDRIFTPDVEVDFGPGSQWSALAAFKSDFGAYHAPFDSTQHVMTNHVVEAEADRAHAFTYGLWRLIRRGVEGGDFWEGTGWYDDELVRTGAGWRISRRVCRVVWWGGNPIVNQPIPGVSFEGKHHALKAEAAQGAVGFVNAVCSR